MRSSASLLGLLLASLAAQGFAGCGEKSPSHPAATVIMPLAVGNRWIWRITSPMAVRYDTLAIVRDTVIAGERWFQSRRGEWMANMADGLHVGDLPDSVPTREQRRVRFPVQPGDTLDDRDAADMMIPPGTFQGIARIYTIVDAVDESITVPAGTFSCIKAFHRCGGADGRNLPCPGSDDDRVYYAPGVGRVREVRYNANPDGRRTLLEEVVLISLTLR